MQFSIKVETVSICVSHRSDLKPKMFLRTFTRDIGEERREERGEEISERREQRTGDIGEERGRGSC